MKANGLALVVTPVLPPMKTVSVPSSVVAPKALKPAARVLVGRVRQVIVERSKTSTMVGSSATRGL